MILPEDLEATLKAAAELSMGTEIADSDMSHIHSLCDQVISITEYRTQLSEYLRNRMQAIAPNLTALVGELVGARLISHAGSLMNLAKHPASTVQILGAEKALFRALKTKHDTPKYGLIYHVSSPSSSTIDQLGILDRLSTSEAQGKDGTYGCYQSIALYPCGRLVRRRIPFRPSSRRSRYH
jgi:nucleolar protein 58